MVSLTVNWLQTVLLPDPPFRKIIIPIPIFSQATCQRFKNIVMAFMGFLRLFKERKINKLIN